jgi:ribosome-binding ATPase YchF (GTP1/OBG family)
MEKTFSVEEAQVVYTTGSTLRGMGNQKMNYALERNLEAIRRSIETSRKESKLDSSEEFQALKKAEDEIITAARALPQTMSEDDKDAWFAEEYKKIKPAQDAFNALVEKWRKENEVTVGVCHIHENDLRELELAELDGAPRDPKHTDAQFLNQYRARYNWIMVMLDCVKTD